MSKATLSMTRSTQEHTEPAPAVGTPRPHFALAVAALVAVTVAGLAVALDWSPSGESAAPAAPEAPAEPGPPAAYLPGGSVYEQQVPGHRHWALVHGPDGMPYKAQVPSAR
ncbi:hypothetical protein [Nocardioides sp. SR21]|uniref:hypothetical protein n=1 Tax=Nocardioides sp. SR21 TaxID=2919501 RepID=UPI001FAA58C8|nr:hypothetical protein [Nocardioides sp. SR21]